MNLRSLLAGVPLTGAAVDLEMEISSISYDSRTLEPGALFVALSGEKTDGHRYMKTALEKGAAAVLCQQPPETEGPWITTEDTRLALALVSANWFGRPGDGMTLLAVTGTNGKTTTTSMLTEILMEARKDPTISVGGMLDAIGGNIRVGGPEMFVTEACEYTNSFLSFFPTMEIILNIEADHLDFFKDIDDIRNSFRRFAGLLPEDGILIINSDIREYEEICKGLPCQVITVGSDPVRSRYSAAHVAFDESACASYELLENGKKVCTVVLGVPGMHNVYNSLAAFAAARELGVDDGDICAGLLAYRGTHRRFEKKGVLNGVTIIDDYAHHPQEIAATLSTAENYPHRELWCVFQPHTYTRTRALMDDFAEALSAADHVVLADIYAARETDTLGISSSMLAEKIAGLGTDAWYFPSFSEIEEFLLEKCGSGDLLITMGAGDIVKVGENLLKK